MTLHADQLEAFYHQLEEASEMGRQLHTGSTAADAAAVCRVLGTAAKMAMQLSVPAGNHAVSTGCTKHPVGPVDAVAPEGWGTCLLCNTKRRRGVAQQLTPHQRQSGSTSR
ncbi:hypothetical protein [Streptomyces sp. NPDC087300]|uniref:hypothetical protein n=1 Tax=Streptomyces sp. NPDC087300 TaxID=3365780 RepID=UPI0038014C2A